MIRFLKKLLSLVFFLCVVAAIGYFVVVPRFVPLEYEEYVEKYGEYTLSDSLYNNALAGRTYNGQSDADKLWLAHKKVVTDLASQGPRVIIGRCASSLLRDRKNVLSVFIYAGEADRVARIASRNRLDEPQARARMRKTDRMRRRYFDFYADTQWGDPESYDVMLSSSYYGVDGCVEMICKSLQMKGNSHE